MTLREMVADRAVRLDGVKANWFRRVPLRDGAVNMFCGGECILGHVFREEAPEYQNGYGWAIEQFQWALHCGGAFADARSLPMWREEISSRLAKFTPAPDAHVRTTANADTTV